MLADHAGWRVEGHYGNPKVIVSSRRVQRSGGRRHPPSFGNQGQPLPTDPKTTRPEMSDTGASGFGRERSRRCLIRLSAQIRCRFQLIFTLAVT